LLCTHCTVYVCSLSISIALLCTHCTVYVCSLSISIAFDIIHCYVNCMFQSIYISRITEGGEAEREGSLRVADRLLAVSTQ